MKKQLLGIVVVLGVLGFAGVRPALAQSDVVAIKVPFPFVVGHTTLPAGTYRMLADPSRPDLVLLTSEDGKAQAAVFTGRAEDVAGSDQASFQFRKVDGQYLLTAINIPGENAREIVLPEPQEPAPAHHTS
jgi:hypothetical protein